METIPSTTLILQREQGLILKSKGTRQCQQITTFEEKGKPKRNRAQVLLTRLTAGPNRPTFRLTLCALYCLACQVRVTGRRLRPLALYSWGAGIAKCLERRTLDQKIAGSSPGRNGGRIFFSSVNFLC